MPGLLPEGSRTATGRSQATEGRTSYGTARIGRDHGHKIHRRLVRPAAVESRVSGVIGGVKVSGYVDLLDIEGRIIDAKSALKPLKGIAHDHHLQLASYVMITPAASGACRLDTVTKGKTVSLIQKSFFINEKDRHYAETIYPMVQDSIREGIFLPRRSSPLCSRRFCGFWNVCEKEYGGSVRCD